MSIVHLLILSTLLLVACSHRRIQDEMSPSDLLVPETLSSLPPERLESKEIQRDVSLVIYALKNAYGGRRFVQISGALVKLSEIDHTPKTPNELCEEIGTALARIQDMHLHARLGRTLCAASKKKERYPSVGKNVFSGENRTWDLQYTEVSGKKIPIISIVSFPHPPDSAWQGFLDVIRKIKRESPALVIDLRGNDGGDDSMGMMMAEVLYGQKFPSPLLSQIKSQTPETMALLVNNPMVRMIRLKKETKEIPKFWFERLSSAQAKYELALSGKIPSEREELVEQGPSYSSKKAFNKPIVLLMDAACASSCESTIDFFEHHSRAITVGENSGGYVHFGNVGFIVLPNSKVLVQMASDFWRYKDGRFIEAVGIQPKVRVTPGEDALQVAKKTLENLLKLSSP